MWRIFLPAAVIVIALVSGCGEADLNPPGSWGVEKTNTLVFLDFAAASTEVDLCDPAAALASVNITTEAVNPALPENTLYLERYAVEYTSPEQGAPTIESAAVDLTLKLPAEGLPLKFIGSALKERLRREVAAESPYTARYTFSGRDRYGSGFGAAASFSFTVGRVAGCPPEALAISPASLSVSGIKNSDNDPTDDVTFFISGGSGPYKVYSDNPAVINSPGELSEGDTVFTVDPDSVGSTVTVTLTVADSSGQKAEAAVTVTPSLAPSQLGILPAKISLAGLQNPDGDPSDDVTFHISGGSGPYKVYSDTLGVINSPGALSVGEAVFTVDPNSVGSSVTVTLTVEDSLGQTVEAEVTVTPLFASSPLSLSPANLSLAGLRNPDDDPTDDVTFYISGGSVPYKVFSNNLGVINSPGELSEGEAVFTIDPDAVTSASTVTLTVVDSEGASISAEVTATPFSAQSALSLSPAGISLTGLQNLDNDPSDDVTFYISGGSGPYKVFSDNVAVIAAPGPLAPGETSFTVDPDMVPNAETVTITVVDSSGQTAEAVVTVNPL